VIYGVIMAGGSGTRFWPKSRRKTPKQLLHITGQLSMIQQTFHRLVQRVPVERIHVITNGDQVDGIQRHLPDLPAGNVVVEPCSRNTAACIGLAAARLAKADPDGIMVVLPADSYVDPVADFLKVTDIACQAAAAEGEIVVLGITPTFPSTGYGYIHRGRQISERDGIKVFDVLAFKEKPDLKVAGEFIRSGDYYWNSGSFMWRVSTIMNAFREFMPDLYAALQRIGDAIGTPRETEVIAAEYEKLQNVSIDYGVMEHARSVKVVEASYKWDDVGTWKSMENIFPADAAGNVVDATAELIDTARCTIVGDPGHLIAAIGVSDLVIIQTPDATLICHRDRAQEVKKIVDKLHEKGMDSYL